MRVLFLDFGNDHLVPEVYPLPSKLCVAPVQAIHCSLYNTLPPNGRDRWSEEVADFFNDYVGGRVFMMTVRSVGREGSEGVTRGGSYMNPLIVEMTERGQEQSLSDVLVTLGMARWVSAEFVSVQINSCNVQRLSVPSQTLHWQRCGSYTESMDCLCQVVHSFI